MDEHSFLPFNGKYFLWPHLISIWNNIEHVFPVYFIVVFHIIEDDYYCLSLTFVLCMSYTLSRLVRPLTIFTMAFPVKVKCTFTAMVTNYSLLFLLRETHIFPVFSIKSVINKPPCDCPFNKAVDGGSSILRI